MQIALRRGDISVTKNIFYDVDVGAARIQPRPQGVTQIVETEVRPTDSLTRRLKRSPDRCDAFAGFIFFMRLAGPLIDRSAVLAVTPVDAEYKYRTPGPFAADIAQELVEVVAHSDEVVLVALLFYPDLTLVPENVVADVELHDVLFS